MLIKIIIGHFLVGFLFAMGIVLWELRGTEFDENFFTKEDFVAIVFLIMFGYITLIAFLIYFIFESWVKYGGKKKLTRIIYNIANIGVKKDENSEIDN